MPRRCGFLGRPTGKASQADGPLQSMSWRTAQTSPRTSARSTPRSTVCIFARDAFWLTSTAGRRTASNSSLNSCWRRCRTANRRCSRPVARKRQTTSVERRAPLAAERQGLSRTRSWVPQNAKADFWCDSRNRTHRVLVRLVGPGSQSVQRSRLIRSRRRVSLDASRFSCFVMPPGITRAGDYGVCSMRLRAPLKVRALSLVLWLAMSLADARAASSQTAPQPVYPCFKHHGRLSSQNGIAEMIWLIGTTRIVGLENSSLPQEVHKYLDAASPDFSYIYGDFDICPLEPDTPGHMRRARVVCAEKLVVQNLKGSRPPFRLRSTWPVDGGGKGAIRKMP
jgi:hypothetical protein